MSAPGASQFSELLAQATQSERRRTMVVAAGVRAAAASAFLLLEVVSTGLLGIGDRSTYLPTLTVYTAIALALFALRGRPVSPKLGWLPSMVDVGAAYAMIRDGIAAGDGAALLAGQSTAAFAFMVALSGLTLCRRAVVTTAAASVVAVAALMHQADARWDRTAASALLLALIAVVVQAAIRRLSFLALDLAQAEVSRQLELRRLTEVDAAKQTIERMLADARAQNERLERLQREKESLVQLIVHDLRSPLNAALLSLEYLEAHLDAQSAPADARQAVEDARTTINRISAMVAQILDTARLEEGRMSIEAVSIPARDLLERVRGLLAPVARDKRVDLAVEAPADLALRGDPRLVGRVLENLLSNAIRHAPAEGRILLAARREGGACVLAVHNNGAPIAPADRERIFDKFQQGPGNSRLAGWGLGLYFCRMVAEAHQGHIAVEDVPGWPASFVLRLPAAPAESPALPAAS